MSTDCNGARSVHATRDALRRQRRASNAHTDYPSRTLDLIVSSLCKRAISSVRSSTSRSRVEKTDGRQLERFAIVAGRRDGSRSLRILRAHGPGPSPVMMRSAHRSSSVPIGAGSSLHGHAPVPSLWWLDLPLVLRSAGEPWIPIL